MNPPPPEGISTTFDRACTHGRDRDYCIDCGLVNGHTTEAMHRRCIRASVDKTHDVALSSSDDCRRCGMSGKLIRIHAEAKRAIREGEVFHVARGTFQVSIPKEATEKVDASRTDRWKGCAVCGRSIAVTCHVAIVMSDQAVVCGSGCAREYRLARPLGALNEDAEDARVARTAGDRLIAAAESAFNGNIACVVHRGDTMKDLMILRRDRLESIKAEGLGGKERAELRAHIDMLQAEVAEFTKRNEELVEQLEDEIEDADDDDEDDTFTELTRELFFTDPEVIAHIDQQMDVNPQHFAASSATDGGDLARRRGLERAYLLAQKGHFVVDRHPFDPAMLRNLRTAPAHPRERAWLTRAEERASAILRLNEEDDRAYEACSDAFKALRSAVGADSISETMYEQSPFYKMLDSFTPKDNAEGSLFGIDRSKHQDDTGIVFGVNRTSDPMRLHGAKLTGGTLEKQIDDTVDALKRAMDLIDGASTDPKR